VAVTKVSLSLDRDLVEQARTLAGSRGLSALVNEALRVQLQHERVRRLLDEMDDEYGPVPEHVTEEVCREWPDQSVAEPSSRRSA
jgi:post-segregation antitoxin (ccd killing protein)